ncbi:MAG: hypothetical protein QOH91_2821 [Mycobacterium sp.]|jgi:uncharacterized RDD family membrane protein YckC|nr:hypothetical protein [Mycobacterium sp.]
MTEQPPAGESYQPPPPPPLPDGLSYPPPPPSSGAVAPPPPGPVVRAQPTESYTPWTTRALAGLIDYGPIYVVIGIGWGIGMALTEPATCVTSVEGYNVSSHCSEPSVFGPMLVQLLFALAALAFGVWNFGYRQGTTGSSIGKSIMKFKVVSEVTGEPLGFGMSLLRQLAHAADAVICYIGFLFPLWDAKRQTLADKIMTTVCLPV